MSLEQVRKNRPLPPIGRILDIVRRERACDPGYDRSSEMRELDERSDEYMQLLWEIAHARATSESRAMDTDLLREVNTLAGMKAFISQHGKSPLAGRANDFLQRLRGSMEGGIEEGFVMAKFMLSSPMYAALARCFNGAPMTH